MGHFLDPRKTLKQWQLIYSEPVSCANLYLQLEPLACFNIFHFPEKYFECKVISNVKWVITNSSHRSRIVVHSSSHFVLIAFYLKLSPPLFRWLHKIFSASDNTGTRSSISKCKHIFTTLCANYSMVFTTPFTSWGIPSFPRCPCDLFTRKCKSPFRALRISSFSPCAF